MEINDLTEKVIGCAYAVHNALGPGFLDKVYENALWIEIESAGLRVDQQHPIPVAYRGQQLNLALVRLTEIVGGATGVGDSRGIAWGGLRPGRLQPAGVCHRYQPVDSFNLLD